MENNRTKFHDYIDRIKKSNSWDLYTIINPTLIKNPYVSAFPKLFFFNKTNNLNFLLIIKNSTKFYIRQLYFFLSYLISFVIYKTYFKRKKIKKHSIGIDIFFLVDKIIKDGEFKENYFGELYHTLEAHNQNFVFIPRLYGVDKNPFSLVKFFKILNKDKRDFLFEFELINIIHFIKLFLMILQYPFKTLRILQKNNKQENRLFNNELIKDINSVGFDAFSRFIYGKNISKLSNIKKIYSWSEFQVVERSFNYGIRKSTDNIELIACQFYLNYETYFNAYIDDIDYDMLSSPHKVLVNGKFYMEKGKKVQYNMGVSLRYKDIFNFKGIVQEIDTLLLGSYVVSDTQYMLDSIESIKNIEGIKNIIFKSHPVVNINIFDNLSNNLIISNKNIYKLFLNTKIVIGTASGSLLEAVACGISVIIIESQDNLTANPLVDYGKGKIWDIAFRKNDIKRLYNELVKYRQNNEEEIKQIAFWYRDNFFIAPTEDNIIKAFELDNCPMRIRI